MNNSFVIAGICLAVIVFFVFSYSKDKKDGALNLNGNDVKKINIATFPSLFEAVDITNEEQIHKIVDYLTSLNTARTNLIPSGYNGMSYVIKINLRNGADREFVLSGNQFFIEPNKFEYEIPYEEATKFDMIIADILESNQVKDGDSSVTGTIIPVNKEASGRDISCSINDEKNVTYNIKVENANILDSTGNGWMILHVGDKVRIFYEKDKQTNNDTIIASTVYIKTAAQ